MNGWAWFWLAWASIGVIAEIVALQRQERKDTLSETVWTHLTKPFASAPANALVWLARIVIITFLLWLVGHFAFGWWVL